MAGETARPVRPAYVGVAWAAFAHGLRFMLRQNRVLLAGGLVFLPVLVPVGMAFLSTGRYEDNGFTLLIQMSEGVHIKILAPLLALFFGCMLVGEEVEAQTLPYLLGRPMPRSSWVVGRFGAYVALSSVLLLTSLALTYAACPALGGVDVNAASLALLARYAAVSVAALVGCGAVCLLLGAVVRRPVVAGVVFLFGWQRLAVYIPGVADFLTIEKYVTALLPDLGSAWQREVIRMPVLNFEKRVIEVGAARAGVMLALVSVLLVALTIRAVRRREYSGARIVGG